jgi:amino acid adenylation domain-containing protein
MYRTGDLARRRRDGAIDYLGRIDHQVKLRGFRIELGEIETALLTQGGVREAAVLLREDRVDDPRLVGYVVAEGGVSPPDLLAGLRATLPEHMVPSEILVLPALPVTANGKLDRGALPAPEVTVGTREETPRSPEEEIACSVLASVLGRETVGVEDNFFGLGGHSLLAVRAVGLLRAALDVDLPANALFEDPTPRRIAQRIRTGSDKASLVVERRADDAEIRPSFGQRQLWFLSQLEGSAAYNVPDGFLIDGPFDGAAFLGAVADTMARHESLRALFVESGGDVTVRLAAPGVPLSDVETLAAGDAETVGAWFRAHATEAFRLDHDLPIRVHLASLPDGRHAVAVVMHHLATDGASARVLYRDLSLAYRTRCLGLAWAPPEPPIRYYDWAVAQRAHVLSGVLDAAKARAVARLADAPESLPLPEDRTRADARAFSGAMIHQGLDRSLVQDLRRVARDRGATLFSILTAGLAAYLHRLSGQDDFVVGTPVSGRDGAETEDLVGYMVNTVPLRLRVDGGDRLDDVIAMARKAVLDGFADSQVPLDHLVQALRPNRAQGRTPLFRVMVVLQPAGRMALEIAGATVTPVSIDAVSARYDLTFAFDDGGDGLDLVLHYADDLFLTETARRILGGYLQVLKALVGSSSAMVAELPLMDAAAAQAEVSGPEAVDGRAAPPGDIVGRFRAIAARHGDDPALEDVDGGVLDYGALDARSDRVARGLAARGVGPMDRVGLSMARGVDLVVAMLGILKVGAAYVPLDPEQPAERSRGMAVLAAPKLVIVETEALAAEAERVLSVAAVALGALAAALEDALPEVRRSGADAAYVMFTSGSTGKPKGVVVPDRAVLRLIEDPGYMVFRPGARIAQVATTVFDAATFEIWGPLLNGGVCVIADRSATYDTESLTRALSGRRIDATFLTTTVFNRAARGGDDVFATLGDVLFGGEAADADAVRRAVERWPGTRFVNAYGPTETTTFASFFPVDGLLPDARGVPIGGPIGATALYVLDAALNPVPRGVPGELYIGGDGLADGYLGAPGQTAAVFLADPFSPRAGARMYKTGDLVRRRADGVIEYLGRADRQIKLRGFRIEPGEIEAAIRACRRDVEDVVVAARRRSGSDDHALYAWITGRTVDAEGEREIKRALLSRLPPWMVPRRVLVLPALPINANGKVDVERLPWPDDPEGDAPRVAEGGVDHQTETEAALAGIWSTLLDGVSPGREDNFFDIGGHSLLGVRLVAAVRDRFAVDLPLRAVFEQATLAALAGAIDALTAKGDGADGGPIARRARRGTKDRSLVREGE